LAWIVEQLALRPSDRVLEVGGGHGVAASLVLERLDGGGFVGLDRSATMFAAATKRNAAAVLAGRAEFIVGSIGTAALGARRFDLVFAARVAALNRVEGLVWAAGMLAPNGTLVLAFDGPDDSATRVAAETAIGNFSPAGLRVATVTEAQFDGALVVCVRAAREVPGAAGSVSPEV
jgi:ubiquinone/menaquinone biosynthesis C-methylase UbiE